MPDDVLTHADIAESLGVSVSTVKNYRSKFPECLPIARAGKPLGLAPECLAVCRAIRKGFGEGLSVEHVRQRLYEQFPSCREKGRAPGIRRVRGTGADVLGGIERSLTQLESAQSAVMERVASLEQRIDAILGRAQASGGVGVGGADSPEMLEELARLREDVSALRRGCDAGEAPKARVVTIRGKDGRAERWSVGRVDAKATPAHETAPQSKPSEPPPEQTREQPRGAPHAPEEQETSAPLGASASAERAAELPADVAALPLVVRSATGDFLGMSLGSGAAVTPAVLEQAVTAKQGPTRAWRQTEEGTWEGTLGSGAQTHEVRMTLVTTPRGNRVAHVERLRLGGRDMDAAFLREFLRRLRDAAEPSTTAAE